VDGVKRPMANGNEGSTPAMGDAQARKLLEALAKDTLKGVRDRAFWPPCSITACAARSCAGCGSGICRAGMAWCIFGSGAGAARSGSSPCMPAQRLIEAVAGHGADAAGPVFRPVTNNRTGELDRPLDPGSVYRSIVLKYGRETGVSTEVKGLCVHSLRATAARNALPHEADIARVPGWLGHANVSNPRLYDRRKMRPEDSPDVPGQILSPLGGDLLRFFGKSEKTVEVYTRTKFEI
jgi:integrase/recombinase XerD